MKQPLRKRHKGSDRDTNQKQLTEPDKTLYYTANDDTTVKLSTYQQKVVVTNNSAFLLVLPSVSDAGNRDKSGGKTFKVSITQDGVGGNVTLTDNPNETYSDGASWPGDFTLVADGDSITLSSSGSGWSVVSNDIQ